MHKNNHLLTGTWAPQSCCCAKGWFFFCISNDTSNWKETLSISCLLPARLIYLQWVSASSWLWGVGKIFLQHGLAFENEVKRENCLFVFVVRRPLKYLWPFLCRLQPFVLWITHLRARHCFWMPKSAFLLASCLQNGITCSLVQRLINPCGKLVFHNAECLEQWVREWAISSFRDSLGWPAVRAGIAGKCSCRAVGSGTALPCGTSLQPWHENPCQVGWVEIVWGKMFPKVWTFFPSVFWLLCGQEIISGFCVRFWFLFLCCVSKVQGDECRVLTWIYGSAQRREKTPQLLFTHV